MFSHIPLMPHAVCWKADPALVWTMVVTNAITFLSYSAICLTLLYLSSKTRRVIARDWGFFLVGFALFIVACGSTHLMEVVTTWVPVFWINAAANIVTAVLSAYVAVQFFRRAPQIGFGVNDYAARLANTENEKMQMAESLLSAQKLEEWSRLSTVVSHEISNPLESIQNLLFLMENSEGASPEVRRLAKLGSEEVARVVTITRSTLGYFRQSSLPEKINLAAAAESVQFLLDGLLRKKGVALEIVTQGDMVVESYPGETRQVLLNLIKNAIEATETRGETVRLLMTSLPDGVQMTVEDNGHGILPEVSSRLFHFGVSTKGEEGNGMGLWAVKHIVDRHQGHIEVEANGTHGTRVSVWWPRHFAGRRLTHPMTALPTSA